MIGRLDQAGHFFLDRHLDRTIEPFDHRANTLTLVVDNRISRQTEGVTRHFDLGLIGAAQTRQQIALVRRRLVEAVKVGTQQRLHIEARQHFAQLALCFDQHLVNRFIEIDDVAVVVGDHHVGRTIIECVLDTQILRRQRQLFLACRQHLRLIMPLHRGAQTSALIIPDRTSDEGKDASANLDLRAVRRREIRQHIHLVRRVLMESVDRAANQVIDLEIRQVFADVSFGRPQHCGD